MVKIGRHEFVRRADHFVIRGQSHHRGMAGRCTDGIGAGHPVEAGISRSDLRQGVCCINSSRKAQAVALPLATCGGTCGERHPFTWLRGLAGRMCEDDRWMGHGDAGWSHHFTILSSSTNKVAEGVGNVDIARGIHCHTGRISERAWAPTPSILPGGCQCDRAKPTDLSGRGAEMEASPGHAASLEIGFGATM